MDLEALMAIVAIGDAITFVGESFTDMALQTAMVWRPVEDLRLRLGEHVTWRRSDANEAAIGALIASAREVRGRRRSR